MATGFPFGHINSESQEASMVSAAQIREHMEIVDRDGTHVGTVDHMEGPDTVKVTKRDPASAGRHHLFPLHWVEKVDAKVHLNKSADEVMAKWKAA
jgi:hypothetical protein